MPRQINTRPTIVYWLIDVRPEITALYPGGLPFYCGKTIISGQNRLDRHYAYARKHPDRSLSVRLFECEGFVRVRIMETVPVGDDWAAREKYWIKMIRSLYCASLNISDGGEGAPGNIHSSETRTKISIAHKGKVLSEATRAKISKCQLGKTISPEHRAKLSAAMKGRTFSDETRAKLSAAHKGKKTGKRPADVLAKVSKALRGRKFSPEHRARISESIRQWHAERKAAPCAS